ncbi:LLM class flavin-dependent oxidoreductase [Brevibacillus borstelensis]|uniref:LLM class flavin-dependent oxidoreductase n=1 Tax=Brevibacillus borstelensis TaxID=45462 RepID=UPI001D0A15EA|nr:LLM class flavin-dependent oxidoreductase [Brevibacillus borstelensis]MCC0565801.1 LLM class flavin-dependent oxidoreductase [Brevibacillus borstelensis]WNF05431.1 LLM class flavin-dependent oxidoreductase [Brevibacillus borstelensis]
MAKQTERNKQLRDIPLSVLDLVPVLEGGTPADSFRNTLDLARHAEKWGYNRYWLAEHHNMPGIASSATSVVIGYVAAGTSTIRVGSGGIMLPNHAPLVVAEQFGTLESMFPGRIDLGLGRAPGTDHLTARALRRDSKSGGEDFPEQLAELREYLNPTSTEGSDGPRVRAVPGEGMNIPIWLLGSSLYNAQLAGLLGLPFAFAGQFSPDNILPALRLYRSAIRPSEVLEEPYAMVGVNVIAADDDETAKRLATSQQLNFLSLVRGRPQKFQPPVESMEGIWADYEKASIDAQLRASIIGSPAVVKEKLQELLDATQADEIIINGAIYDHQARLRSFEIVKQVAAE